MPKQADEKLICQNKRARHDFFIEETYEAGLVLVGSEVKSLRVGKANLVDSFARIHEGEIYLQNLHISPYSHATHEQHEPQRLRKLLLKKTEIRRLYGKVRERGYTLVPLRVYFKHGIAKVELGLARGKKTIDKRETMRRRDMEREAAQAMRNRR